MKIILIKKKKEQKICEKRLKTGNPYFKTKKIMLLY